MAAHKYKVGQALFLSQSRMGHQESPRACKVVRCLPMQENQLTYRIKCNNEVVERIVKESMLSRTQ